MLRIFAGFIIFCTMVFGANLGKLATGNMQGTYYAMGKDIADLFFKYKLILSPVATEGSIQNLDILYGLTNQNDFSFALVQSDAIKYYNYFMLKNFNTKTTDIIKVVLPLYLEEIHVLAKDGKKIEFIKDKEYFIACGKKESGSCITAKYIEQAYGVKFKYNHDVDFETGIGMLKEEKLDVVVSVIGKPSKILKAAEGIQILSLADNLIMDGLYKRGQLTPNDYNWLQSPVNTYAVPSVLVTNIPEGSKNQKVIEAFVKILVKNQEYLRQFGHSKWKEVDYNLTKPSNFHSVALKTFEDITK